MIDIKCGNCIDLLDTIPDGSVDLILTDPPYNISIKNNNRDRSNLSSPFIIHFLCEFQSGATSKFFGASPDIL